MGTINTVPGGRKRLNERQDPRIVGSRNRQTPIEHIHPIFRMDNLLKAIDIPPPERARGCQGSSYPASQSSFVPIEPSDSGKPLKSDRLQPDSVVGLRRSTHAHRAFDEYLDFIHTAKGPIRFRVALAFYCHVAEASGFYEVPKNMLRVVGGEGHVLWPFMHLVEAHRATGTRVAPNANKVLKDLAGHAETLGLHELAEVFRDAFDADIRNGYAHADYVIWNDGLRLIDPATKCWTLC